MARVACCPTGSRIYGSSCTQNHQHELLAKREVSIYGHGIACVPVRWVWEGKRRIRNPEELNSLRNNALYAEYDIEVQRELLELMPEDCQIAPEW